MHKPTLIENCAQAQVNHGSTLAEGAFLMRDSLIPALENFTTGLANDGDPPGNVHPIIPAPSPPQPVGRRYARPRARSALRAGTRQASLPRCSRAACAPRPPRPAHAD